MALILQRTKPSRFKFAVKVFTPNAISVFDHDFQQYDLLDEADYVIINEWCVTALGYHARTAYEKFEFKSAADETAFRLRWS